MINQQCTYEEVNYISIAWHLIDCIDSNIYINKLINDFSKLLNDQPFYDVEMTVGQDQEHTKTFRVHSTVLRARSPYFNVALSNKWIRRSKDGIIIFEKKNTTPKVFEIIIK